MGPNPGAAGSAELGRFENTVDRLTAKVQKHLEKWPATIRHAFRATVGRECAGDAPPAWGDFEVWFFYANDGLSLRRPVRLAPRPGMIYGAWSCIVAAGTDISAFDALAALLREVDEFLAGEYSKKFLQSYYGLGWLYLLYFLKWDLPDYASYCLCGASFSLRDEPLELRAEPFHSREAFEAWERGESRLPEGHHFVGTATDIRECLLDAFAVLRRESGLPKLEARNTAQTDLTNEVVQAFKESSASALPAVDKQTPSEPGEQSASGLAGMAPDPSMQAAEAKGYVGKGTHQTEKRVQFAGGQMVFFKDRVELCGVDICSGPRSEPARCVLDLLRQKRDDGTFEAYSGNELAEKADRSGVNSVAGLIRDIRDKISMRLRQHSNITCGRKDVVLSRGRGYRLADCVSVQNDGQRAATPITDTDDNGDVRNVRNDDVRNVPDVPDDSASTRRAWILQRLTEKHRLQASEVAKKFKCSLKTAQRDLQSLKAKGRIKFVGAPRTGYYHLLKGQEPRK